MAEKSGKRSRLPLAVSALLLAALLVAGFTTSSPRSNPYSTWATRAWSLYYELYPVEEQAAAEEMHLDSASLQREQCVACHGDKTDSALPVHRIHLESELLPGLACMDCHTRIELRSRGATLGVTQVDVGFCKKCHSEFPGGKPESHMHKEDINADCKMCHTGARAMRHAQPYLSQIIPTEECRGCHGGRVLPWTPRHETDGWLEVHGQEALDIGTEHCLECHDFGLKFCDECHAQTPPSHLPEDDWRNEHPSAAANDTRPCYTCHETEDCKQCHVDHEADWLDEHPEFVRVNGDDRCEDCHSLSSCSFCHSAAALGTAEVTTLSP
ncbi:MAG: hypothetical protein Kow0056_10350 [Coriobacteriia bacterium]